MDEKIFKIGVFGLTSNEQNTLGSIFKLAAARPRKYTLVGPTDRATADIVLVDVNDTNAENEWRSFSVHYGKIPLVKVTKTMPQTATDDVYLRRPLTLKRVLETLDDVTIKVHKFVPEITIDDNMILHAGDDAATIDLVTKRAQTTDASGIKALVVDDSLPVRRAMELQLGLYGMGIDFAETGEEALEYIQENVYDIIFLDVMLPGVDGLKVCRQIKSDKTSKKTPVVMLTGKDSRFDKIKGTMAGANEYLTKPVQQEQLKEVIKQFLPNTAINHQ
jgi:twitching motility two-component system response regulator PilG